MYDVASTTVSWTRHDKTHLGQPGGWPQLNRNAKSVGSDYRSQRTAVDLEPAKTSSQGCCRFVSLKRSASVPFFPAIDRFLKYFIQFLPIYGRSLLQIRWSPGPDACLGIKLGGVALALGVHWWFFAPLPLFFRFIFLV